jgi:sulfur carrier protein
MSESQKIHINGEPSEVPEGCTVDRLLALRDLQNRRVAVALNHTVVPRSSYATTTVNHGDRIEILEAVGGG